jgi:hypothetical protein
MSKGKTRKRSPSVELKAAGGGFVDQPDDALGAGFEDLRRHVQDIGRAAVDAVQGFAFAGPERHDHDLTAGAQAGGSDGEAPTLARDLLTAEEEAFVVLKQGGLRKQRS